MHSFARDGIIFHHDQDLATGRVIILQELQAGETSPKRIIMPGKVLLEFVAEYVRTERIAKLEQQKPLEILGVHS